MELDELGRMDRIRSLIEASGRRGTLTDSNGAVRELPAIRFDTYMAFCLYDEQFGYYAGGAARVGREGDFYTSSAIGTVLGDVLADHLAGRAELAGPTPIVYEWGAGTGRLGLQVLARWQQNAPELAGRIRYRMVDSHAGHRLAAREAADEAGFGNQVEVLSPEDAERLLQEEREAVMLANELLDAFPVRRLLRKNGVLSEIGVAYDEREHRLRDCLLPLTEEEQAKAEADERGISLVEGQQCEWRPAAVDWIRRMCGKLDRGTMILIDYGDEARELFAAHRNNGSLMCYYRHQAHDNPYLHPGEQDMTAHVNFSGIRAAAEASHWHVDYYGTQKNFLVDHGIFELLQSHNDPNPFSEVARRNRSIRQLLLSDGMSELFKVIVLNKSQG